MADTSSQHIIQYTADIDGLLSKLKELQRLNSTAASQMTTDFSRAVDIVEQRFTRLSQSTIKVPQLDAKGVATGVSRDQVTVVEQLTSTVKNANGGLEKFVETNTRVDGAIKKSTISLIALKTQLDKPATVFLGSLEQITGQLSNLDRITKQVQGTFGANAKIASVGTPTVSSTKTQNSIIDGVSVAQQTQSFDTSVKLVDGSSKTLRDTLISVGGQVTKTSSTFVEASTSSRTFADNIRTLISRAALTIPVWFALRSAITSVFFSIRDGVSNFITFDTALQKLKLNISGTPAEIERGFNQAKSTITDFSRQTGISTEEISKAVEKFATIGFSIDDALAGGIASTKLAIVLFGDASDTATAFARSIKILADTSKDAVSVQEQMNEVFALTAQLQATNQFDLNEVNESLIKFAPTAKNAGLSLRETVVLLAALGTGGLTGARAGTLLSSSVSKLSLDLNKLAGSLGISVNPNLDTTFSLISKVVDKAVQLQSTGGLNERAFAGLSEVFGGQRGTQAILALTAMNKVLKENAAIIPDVNALEERFQATNDTLGNNVRKLVNDLKENGKAFVGATVGGKDFNETIKKLDSAVKGANTSLQALGFLLNAVFVSVPAIVGFSLLPAIISTVIRVGVVGAIIGASAVVTKAAQGLIGRIAFGFLGGIPGIIVGIGSVLAASIPFIFNSIDAASQAAFQKTLNNADKVQQGLAGKLSKTALTKLIIDLKNGDVQIQNVPVDKIQAALEKELNKTAIKELKIKVQTADVSFLTVKESQDLNKSIIQDQLDALRTQGANTSELLTQESLLNKQFNIYEDENTILQRTLATQRAKTDELRLQSRLGSDSIKLFEIAKTEGVNVAQTFGRVLAGTLDISSLTDQEFQDFKKNFADKVTQIQAQQFFKGQITPVQDLAGGQQIPIQERVVQQGLPSPLDAQLASAQARAETPVIRAEIQNRITANIGIEVKGISFREAVKVMKAELARDLLNPESDTSKSLSQFVEGQ